MSSVAFRRLDREAALRALRDYVAEELAPRPELREVVLIGSLARGDWSARSDADLVVLVDRSDEPCGPFRAPDYLPRRPMPLPVDVLVYTPAEAAGWRPRFKGEVERGVVLYGRGVSGSGSTADDRAWRLR